MKTFIADIIPSIQRFSQKLENLTLLTEHHWVLIGNSEKNVYIFRKNNELLIALNGKISKGKWDYLGYNSLLIDIGTESYLFKHGFFDENILALKLDSKEEYIFFVNETKYEQELNSINNIINFLNQCYNRLEIKDNSSPSAQVIDNFEILDNSIPACVILNEIVVYKFFDCYKQFTIRFDNGIEGFFYQGEDSQKYFIRKLDDKIYYNSKIAAIKGLYSLLKNNIISDVDRVKR